MKNIRSVNFSSPEDGSSKINITVEFTDEDVETFECENSEEGVQQKILEVISSYK